MKRSFWLMLLLTASVGSQVARADYIVGGVDIYVTPRNSNVRSPADATRYNNQGEIVWGAVLQGYHNIYLDGFGAAILDGNSIFSYGNVASFASGTGDVGSCYSARLVIISGSLYFERFAGPICVPDPPDSDPFCEITWIGCSPIVVDLDGNGYHLTGLDDPVQFDIDADGGLETLAWTQTDQQDALLCLDRDGDGLITNGSELFGDSTLLSNGERADLGFEALAELDTPEMGGNTDGLVSIGDAAFGELCLWVDRNHDAFSDPEELLSLSDGRVVGIDLNYVLNGRRDQHGNVFRYEGTARILNPAGRPRAVPIYDIFFRVEH